MRSLAKRLAAALLTLAAAVSMTGAAFSESVNGLSLSSKSAEPGEEFTLTLTVPPTEDADTASIKVVYDDSAFEPIEWDPQLPGSYSNAENGLIAISAANADRDIDLSKGLTLTARMKVRDSAANGEYTFTLIEGSICYFNESTFEFVELWESEVNDVTMTVVNGAAETQSADEQEELIDPPVTEAAVTTTAQPLQTDSSRSDQGSQKTTMLIIIIAAASVVVVAVIIAIVLMGNKKSK